MYIEQCWQGAVEIITEYMSFDRYCDFMSKMDICIFNGTGSYALGNLAIALAGRKTIFLNRKGILKEGFLTEKIPFHYTDEIADMSWENFSKLLEYEIDENSTLIMKSYEEEVNMWKAILEECR